MAVGASAPHEIYDVRDSEAGEVAARRARGRRLLQRGAAYIRDVLQCIPTMAFDARGPGEARRDALPEGLAVSAFGGKAREDVVHVVRVDGVVDEVTCACRMDRHGGVGKRVGARVIVGRTDLRVDERAVAGKGMLAASNMVTESSLSSSSLLSPPPSAVAVLL